MTKQSASFVLAFASFVWAVVPVYGVPVSLKLLAQFFLMRM